MTDEIRFTVLVSTDDGVNWRRYAGVIASATQQACKRVQEAHYADKPNAMFYATQRFAPRKMVERMVPKLDMQQIDLDGTRNETELTPSAETPMPHQASPDA